jgi:hypothetical protein
MATIEGIYFLKSTLKGLRRMRLNIKEARLLETKG